MAAAASCSACEARRLTRKMSTKMIEPRTPRPDVKVGTGIGTGE